MIGPGKSRHCQNWLERRHSWNENLQRVAELNCDVHKSERKCWDNQVSFCHALSAEKPRCCHEYCRSRKKTLGKHAVAVNTEDHSIGVLNERSVSVGGNLCPLWFVILKSDWHSIGDVLQQRCSWPWAVVSYIFSLLDTEKKETKFLKASLEGTSTDLLIRRVLLCRLSRNMDSSQISHCE